MSLLLPGCAGLGGASSRPTLEAEVTALVEEATQIGIDGAAMGTQIAATVAAAQTAVNYQESVNRQLALTLRAVVPPTAQVVANAGIVTPGMNAPLNGGAVTPAPIPGAPTTESGLNAGSSGASAPSGQPNQFTEIAVASDVRADDGCALNPQSSFPTNVPRVYATTRVYNIVGGTSVYVEWRYEGQVVATSTPFSVPANDADYCLWFYLEPTDAAFQIGNWTAQFYANGGPVQPSAQFTLN